MNLLGANQEEEEEKERAGFEEARAPLAAV